jgi:hypothetical protein
MAGRQPEGDLGDDNLLKVAAALGFDILRQHASARVSPIQPPWKGKSARLTIEQTEQAVKSLDWSDANQGALAKISKFRGLRNMLAHFVLRRFPKEDAFVCAAISARDYEKQLGVKPVPGAVLTAVLDHDQVKEAVKHIEHVQLWLARVTSEFELKFRQA